MWKKWGPNQWFCSREKSSKIVFQNTRILKFKLEVRFSFFILIWKTKNQIYLNKYLMKLVTRSHYAITINKYKNQIALMIKHQIFVNKHLPVQTQRKVNISKRNWICSNLLIKILKQCHWRNYSVVIITFQHDISLHLSVVTVYSTS